MIINLKNGDVKAPLNSFRNGGGAQICAQPNSWETSRNWDPSPMCSMGAACSQIKHAKSPSTLPKS